jgi:vacuolar-type H+-ATPase catalytic subunit A/Vma1
MLYDFHKWQNDRRPETLHATYLVYGIQKKQPEQAEQEDEDVEIADSTSEVGHHFSDEVLTHTLTLTKEEQLQGERVKRRHLPDDHARELTRYYKMFYGSTRRLHLSTSTVWHLIRSRISRFWPTRPTT